MRDLRHPSSVSPAPSCAFAPRPRRRRDTASVTVERRARPHGHALLARPQGEDAAALEDAARPRPFETIARLEDVASNWSDTSGSRASTRASGEERTAGRPPRPDLFDVLARATAWSARTHGAFDATVEPLTRAYDLRGKGRIPAEDERAHAGVARAAGRA